METKPPVCQFLNESDRDELASYYNGRQLGWCQVGNHKFLMPHAYAENGEGIWRTKVRATDRWIVTFPRSGTTWMQELVWLLNNDLNYEEAAKKRIAERFYFPDFEMINGSIDESAEEITMAPGKLLPRRRASDVLESLPSPRFIKTHLPFEMLPPGLLDAGCKVVYVARNPKDVVVSFYHMKTSRKVLNYTGDFRSFWNFFERDLKLWCPYWPHVKQAWSLRRHPNLLFLFYEEMKTDLPAVIRKAAHFYGRPCSDEDVARLARHLDIESFKKNPMIGSRKIGGRDLVSKDMFVRRGQIGSWRELFTPDLEAQADRWIEENLRDSDLEFPCVKLLNK